MKKIICILLLMILFLPLVGCSKNIDFEVLYLGKSFTPRGLELNNALPYFDRPITTLFVASNHDELSRLLQHNQHIELGLSEDFFDDNDIILLWIPHDSGRIETLDRIRVSGNNVNFSVTAWFSSASLIAGSRTVFIFQINKGQLSPEYNIYFSGINTYDNSHDTISFAIRTKSEARDAFNRIFNND